MKTYMIGDLHFNHANIIRYCNRPFDTVHEMNQKLVENWNSVVQPDDVVYVLGDFCLGNKHSIIEFGRKLNGHKTLILGNHDNGSMKIYYDAGFEAVSKHPILIDDFYLLSHTPQNIMEDGLYANIFAHVHDNPIYKDVSSRSFCVSAERINYTPISFETIQKAMKNESTGIVDSFEGEIIPLKRPDSNLDKCSSYAVAPNGCPLCMSTKELDPCGCNGDMSKCDFFTWQVTDVSELVNITKGKINL